MNPSSAATALNSIGGSAEPWIRNLARLGYIAKGIVYIVVGIIAVRAAIGSGGDPADSRGALETLLEQPFGRVLLGIVALGLAGYVIWRCVLAFRDPEKRGKDFKGLAVRAGYLISAALHTGLAVAAGSLVVIGGRAASSGGGQDQQAQSWTAMAMSQPFGRWAVAVVGGIVVVFGLYEIIRAIRADLVERLDLLGMPYEARQNVVRLGRMGLFSRGIVFGLIGWFLIRSALQYDPSEARGLGGALETLQTQPYGPYLLGLVAIGLTGYGVFQIAKGRYGIIASG